jgi:hypothetical protein
MLEGKNCLPEIMLDGSRLFFRQNSDQPPEGGVLYTPFAVRAGVCDPHPEFFRVVAAFDEGENFRDIFQLPALQPPL